MCLWEAILACLRSGHTSFALFIIIGGSDEILFGSFRRILQVSLYLYVPYAVCGARLGIFTSPPGNCAN